MPLKWISRTYKHNWHYVKSKNRSFWLEYNDTNIESNYSEISFDLDPSGLPVVVLMRLSDQQFIKLTQGICYRSFDSTNIQNVRFSGYWSRKDGKKTILLTCKS